MVCALDLRWEQSEWRFNTTENNHRYIYIYPAKMDDNSFIMLLQLVCMSSMS